MKPKVEILREKIEEGKLGGGVKRIEAQHKKGKLTARERSWEAECMSIRSPYFL